MRPFDSLKRPNCASWRLAENWKNDLWSFQTDRARTGQTSRLMSNPAGGAPSRRATANRLESIRLDLAASASVASMTSSQRQSLFSASAPVWLRARPRSARLRSVLLPVCLVCLLSSRKSQNPAKILDAFVSKCNVPCNTWLRESTTRTSRASAITSGRPSR